MWNDFEHTLKQAIHQLRKKEITIEDEDVILNNVFDALDERKKKRRFFFLLFYGMGGTLILLVAAGIYLSDLGFNQYVVEDYCTAGFREKSEIKYLLKKAPSFTENTEKQNTTSTSTDKFTSAYKDSEQENKNSNTYPNRLSINLEQKDPDLIPARKNLSVVNTIPSKKKELFPKNASINQHFIFHPTDSFKRKTSYSFGFFIAPTLNNLTIIQQYDQSSPFYQINEDYKRKLLEDNPINFGVLSGLTFKIKRGIFAFETGIWYSHVLFHHKFSGTTLFHPDIQPNKPSETDIIHSSILIPIMVGLEFPVKKFSLGFNIGLSAGYVRIRKGYNYTPGSYTLIKGLYNSDGFTLNPTVKLNAAYHISKLHSIYISPFFSHNVLNPSFYQNTNGITTLPYSYGLYFGYEFSIPN